MFLDGYKIRNQEVMQFHFLTISLADNIAWICSNSSASPSGDAEAKKDLDNIEANATKYGYEATDINIGLLQTKGGAK